MEVLLAAGVFLSAWVAAGVASGGPAAPSREASSRLAARWLLRALRLLRRAGRTRVAEALLACGPWREHARGLSAAAASRGVELDERSSAVALGVLLAALSVGSGLLMGSPVAGVAAGAVVVAGAHARDGARRARERREVMSTMPGVYRTLSVALASGQTLAQAVSYVGAHERGPVADVFTRMSLRLRCGSSTEDAVVLLARELDVPGAELLAIALVISHRTGSPLRGLLMRSAALAERQGEFERLLGVKTAQVRLSVRIVSLLPAAMLALLALVSPDFQAGLLTPTGLACVALAAALDATALLIIRRLMSGVRRWT